MSAVDPTLTVALYSEDRSDADGDFAVLRELVYGMLQQIVPDLKTNHVTLEPAQPVRKERISGSYWKVTNRGEAGAQERRRRLIRDVAAALRLGRVVVFHVDADEVWAARASCRNIGEHWPHFFRDVQTTLRNAGHVVKDVELGHILIEAVPFWEIESWTFANTARLREIVSKPQDAEMVATWEGDLRALDEIENIKDALSIGDAHNGDLVQRKRGFPAAALIAAGKSYAAVVRRLGASPVVLHGLTAAAARSF